MKRVNLTDTTFLIPVRIDSQKRMENIVLVLEFIKEHFDTNITVLEADKKELVQHTLIDQKIFIEDQNPVFHRTKYLNQMTRKAATPYLAIWDTDVLLNSLQIEKAICLLRSESADMVFPYDGRFYNIAPLLEVVYKSKRKIDIFEKNIKSLYLMHGYHSVGGAFLVNKNKYCEAGMENENFYGWGPEDAERVKRWEILGYNIHRVEGALYHLYHPRMENSGFASQKLEMQNKKELIRVCQMTESMLRKYIKSKNYGKGTNAG